MPAKSAKTPSYCLWCNEHVAANDIASHVHTIEHTANVRKTKRAAAYRNRQGELPFPPTLHDPPKLR